MNKYQKTYEKKAGSAKISIKKAVAGSKVNCRLTYTVGPLGIDDSGSMKILFRIASDVGNPQFLDSKRDNYVKITSSNKRVEAKPLTGAGLYGKLHERPWTKGLIVYFSNTPLEEGDDIYIDFKRWEVQTFTEDTFECKVMVDPFATAKYVEIQESPTFKIVPDKINKLKVLAPTQVLVGDKFKAVVKVEDKYGNPCVNKSGSFLLDTSKEVKGIPSKINFKNGRALIEGIVEKSLTTTISVRYKKLHAVSNVITSVKDTKYRHYWADFHAQSEETVGTNDVEHYFRFARDYALLDVASHQGNDFQISTEFWKKLNETTKKFNEKDNFITFPGYEWSGNTSNGGDRNVIYRKEGLPIYRSSHALVNDFTDIGNDANCVSTLFKKVPKKDTVIFAHIGGRHADIAKHDEKVEKAIEIHSTWGTFEWFLLKALDLGYKVGVVANSDGHTGRPGACYPGLDHFNNYGGLTCVLADSLNRKSIFNALKKRHTYGTTGARIYLDVKCTEGTKTVGIMGDDINFRKNLKLDISCRGTAPIERVEIYNHDKVIYSKFPEMMDTDEPVVKLLWSGSKFNGRKRDYKWNLRINLLRNSLKRKKIRKINFFNPAHSVLAEAKKVVCKGNTTGGVQGIIFELNKKTGTILLNANDRRIKVRIKDIGQRGKGFKMGGLDAKVEVYELSKSKKVKFDFEHNLRNLKNTVNPIFVKVIQEDGHMAWSSPVYINKTN